MNNSKYKIYVREKLLYQNAMYTCRRYRHFRGIC